MAPSHVIRFMDVALDCMSMILPSQPECWPRSSQVEMGGCYFQQVTHSESRVQMCELTSLWGSIDFLCPSFPLSFSFPPFLPSLFLILNLLINAIMSCGINKEN